MNLHNGTVKILKLFTTKAQDKVSIILFENTFN